MYDAYAALQAIDAHTAGIMACLAVTVTFAFLYFFIAFALARKQSVYVVPFSGAALFFWHDLTFVLMYDKWFHVYGHWWVRMWWYALVGTVIMEALMLYQVYRYGRRELWPHLSNRAFGALIVAGTLGIGALWALVKASLSDELFFVTFTITASFSVPFHTALLSRRQSRAGQSIVMELSTIVMLWSLTGAFAQATPFFHSPVYLGFFVAFTLWPLVNIGMMLRYPRMQPGAAPARLVPARTAAPGIAQGSH